MAEDLDSKAASFSLKRSHGEISQPGQNGSTAPSTPHKRMKASEGWHPQEVENGKSFDLNGNATLVSSQGHGATGDVSVVASDTASTPAPVAARTVSPMSWNSGAKAKIRVSLQRKPKDVMSPRPEGPSSPPAGLPTSSENQTVAQISVPLEPQSSMSEGVAGWESLQRPGRGAYQKAQAEDRCVFIGNLPTSTSRKQVVQIFKPFDMAQMRVRTMPGDKSCYAFCVFLSSNDASWAVERTNGRTYLKGKKLFVKLDEGAQAAKPTQESRQKPLSPDPNEFTESKLEIGKVPAPGSGLEEQELVILESSPVTRAKDCSGGFEEGKTYLFELPPSSSNSVSLTAKDSPAGNDIVVNIEDNSEYESGEVTPPDQGGLQPATTLVGNQSTTDDSCSNNWYIDTSHTGEDDMMDYANSKASDGDSSYRHPPSAARAELPLPKCLKDLSTQDLELQLRYFHVGKAREDVDIHSPVHCLTCNSTGHMAVECAQVSCVFCPEPNDHSSSNCPRMQVCVNCARLGHTSEACTAGRLVDRARCDLCDREGHVAYDCELRWRTSGRPWDSNLEDQRKIHFSCYECGRSGHLGNDCPTRRPGKPKASSSWTYYRKDVKPESSKQGFSIKGKAQQKPIVISDSDDDTKENFYRRKVLEPPHPGRPMRIMAPTRTQNSQLTSYGFSSRQRSASPRREGYSGPDRYEPRYGPFNNQQPPLPREPPPYRRRSPSPPVASRRPRGGDAYRPMPSAGQQAWRQFRR
ncbi:MAG: hypothetical protein Q9174_004120 [Haloplaca sp. 1 TL-2023]